MSPLRPALFVDRDGTVIVEKHYLADPDGVELLAGAAGALAEAAALGFAVVIVSNQSGVGRGRMTEADVQAVNHRTLGLIEAAGGPLVAGVYYCPHAPDDECRCRKPAPGMLLDAARDLVLDLASSYMIGDKADDIGAGQRAGVRGTILVQTGHGLAQTATAQQLSPSAIVADLAAALRWIRADRRHLPAHPDLLL